VATDRLINLYVEESSNQKGVYTLYSMPGLRQVALLPSGPVRGLYEATNGRVYAVTSTTLFEVFEGWTFLTRGTVHTGTDPASMVDDGQYLIITVDGFGYSFEFATDTFANLPLTGPLLFGQVVYLDGYILSNEPGTRRVWYAEPLNPVVWPGANVLQAEGRADNTVTLLSDHSQLWIFGTQTIELWDTTGNSLAPFARNASAFVEQGCETPWSAVALDNSVWWLGGSPRGEGPVWTTKGYEPARVSTHALESAMSTMPTVGDAIAFGARHGGHAWYVISFVSGGQTWAFDSATQSWNELVTLADDGSFLAFPCYTHCPAFAEHLFGDRETGKLYIWDPAYGFYGDKPMYKERTAPHIRNDQQRIRYSKFELVMETGIGLDAGVVPGSDPQVMMSYSDDGGHTWSQRRFRSAGKIGATNQQIVWRQLGQSRQRAFRVAISDPVFVAILGATIDAS
jgi:hypothetical protein